MPAQTKEKICFSGIQPTGKITLGNYLGAIQNYLEIQKKHRCLFSIANLHALTNIKEKNIFNKHIIYNTAIYIAVGIDYKKHILFQQSSVQEHCELAWILSCFCKTGLLNRMIQFKEKIKNNKRNINLGLYSYPVLMASDILLYNAHIVPAGEDQKQHIELTRNLALTLNKYIGYKFFNIPEHVTNKFCGKIMSLTNANNKMSKSNASELSRINICDNEDIIRKKISRAKTDNEKNISYDPVNRKEVANLIHIYSGITNMNIYKTIDKIKMLTMKEFKNILSEAIINKIRPINKTANQFLQNEKQVIQIIENGNKKAQSIAKPRIKKLKAILGL